MDEDNFEFKIDTYNFIMINGVLSINDCEYENVEDGGAEMYAIARAYWIMMAKHS